MDESEIIAAALAILQRRTAGETAKSPTVAELYAVYESASKHRGCWPTIMYLLRPVLKEFGPRTANSLTVADWTAYRTPREGKYSGSTLNQQLAWLKTLLRWSHEQGTLSALPHLSRAKPARCKVARETATTEDDVTALLALARPQERVLVLCACDAGMRRNEIRQLQWSWIDRVNMELVLPDWACKGRRGRTTQLTHRLLDAIDAIPRDIRSPYVLVSPVTGEPFHTMTLGKWWRELAREAKLQPSPGEKGVSAHCGRAGMATNAAERGVRVEVISEMLGHASLETTIKYIRRRARRRADLAVAREAFERGILRDKR